MYGFEVDERYRLSSDEVESFRKNGYLGPFTALSPEAMAELRTHIDTDVLTRDGPNPKSRYQSRHMDSGGVARLASCAPIIERIACLLGPDLIVWATNFFCKEPGGSEIPWHQDLNYWPLEPVVTVSAWVAIDRASVENSCVRVIPGSHRTVYPLVKSEPGTGFGFSEKTDPRYFDAASAIPMELEAGEFFIFTERLLHQSEPNRSQHRRMGMSVRVIPPFVKLDQTGPPLHPGHKALLARGRDYMGINDLMAIGSR